MPTENPDTEIVKLIREARVAITTLKEIHDRLARDDVVGKVPEREILRNQILFTIRRLFMMIDALAPQLPPGFIGG